MAIVRNTQTSHLYRWEGENRFTNIITGVTGDIPDDLAKKYLKINLEATAIFSEYPMIEDMVKRLGLISDKTTTEEK